MNCRRSLYSQTGLGSLIGLYTIIKLISGAAKKDYIERHTIKIQNVMKVTLDPREFIEVLGLSITATSGLFLLANYGASGDVRGSEVWFFGASALAGFVSLLIIAACKGVAIYKEIQHDQEDTGVPSPATRDDTTLVAEISSYWVALGIVATTIHVGKSMRVATSRRIHCHFLNLSNYLPSLRFLR